MTTIIIHSASINTGDLRSRPAR